MKQMVIAAAVLTLAAPPTPAHGSGDEDYCTLWARATLAADVAAFDAVRRATFTRHDMLLLYRNEFGRCYTADQRPSLPLLETDGMFVDRVYALLHAGSIPATDTKDPAPAAVGAGDAPPVAKTPSAPAAPTGSAVAGNAAPAQICARAHRKIRWVGKSWRCY